MLLYKDTLEYSRRSTAAPHCSVSGSLYAYIYDYLASEMLSSFSEHTGIVLQNRSVFLDSSKIVDISYYNKS